MTTRQDTLPAPAVPSQLTWRKAGPYYVTDDRTLQMAAMVGRTGRYHWYIKAWPVTAGPHDLSRETRLETGLRTMAEARAMALRTPCFRCGRGRPLTWMERYSPRWRCLDYGECEAERARLLTAGSGPDPRLVGVFLARQGTDAGRELAGAWATAFQRASVRRFGVRNPSGLTAADLAALAAEADTALQNVISFTDRRDH